MEQHWCRGGGGWGEEAVGAQFGCNVLRSWPPGIWAVLSSSIAVESELVGLVSDPFVSMYVLVLDGKAPWASLIVFLIAWIS